MSTHDLIERCRKWPLQLRRQQVLLVAKKLGLGQRRVLMWMAHHAQRSRPSDGEQWKYPRDATVQGLLDMAGIGLTIATTRPLAGGRGMEGVPGSIPHDPA